MVTIREALDNATRGAPTGVKWTVFGWVNMPILAWYLHEFNPDLAIRLYRQLPGWIVPVCLVALPIVTASLITIWVQRAYEGWPPIVPLDWRRKRVVEIRTQRARAGFTLLEMLVSVVLVLLMMLMFARIFGMAQGIISKQKGIAENDQKARILAQVMRNDLETRTFRSVYPFKLEMTLTGGPPPVPTSHFPIVDASGMINEQARQTLESRRGYFAFSENDPTNDTDDTLSLTIDVGDPTHGSPGQRIFGKASPVDPPLTNGLPDPRHDGPEYDDGRIGDGSGSSPMAEVTYFLRYGNLYRSVLLIRSPYLKGDTRAGGIGQDTPATFPQPVAQFWQKFDFSAYRDGNGTQFHGFESLSNNPEDNAATPLLGALHAPRTLAAPPLRYGHSYTPHGQPLEFGGAADSSAFGAVDIDTPTPDGPWEDWHAAHPMFSRLTTQERSSAAVEYPGDGFAPFSGVINAAMSDGTLDAYPDGGRRGVDIMLPNVHNFDVQVWDDILKRYVDIGYGDPDDTDPTDNTDVSDEPPPGQEASSVDFNPYTYTPGAAKQFGFYHISRLRRTITSGVNPLANDEGSIPTDFGNRYDTWCPNMYLYDGTTYSRNGRAPYRPLQSNPDPNTPQFNDFAELGVAFGDSTLDDGGDGAILNQSSDTDAEAPLRAIRIVVRYLDPHSGQTRQTTIEQSLID